MKVLSLFSGIGAFESALKRLGREYELVNYCEIDKYASKGYAAIHNVPESLNLGDITSVDFAQPNSTTRRGRVGHGVCQTLDTGSSKYAVTATISDLRIRKLTPKECFRLMGFTDEEFQRVADVPTSNAQLYKMAGNSIVVDVLVHLMRGMWLYL